MIDFTVLSRSYFQRVYNAEIRAEESLEASQRKLLGSLLSCGVRTAYGAAYRFADIDCYERFADVVPQADYATLRPWVMRMVGGEAGVLWPGVTRSFAQSSGTSDGKSKFIPLTSRSLSRGHYAGAAFSLASYLHNYPHSRVFGGKNFILGGSFANELQLPRGVRVGDLSATLINSINPLVNLFRIPSKRVALMENWTEKLPRLVEASLHADVRSISGVPSWFLAVLQGVMKAAGATNIHQVWPNLEVFFHGGIAFGPYRGLYESITDGSRMHYWENYNASEGFFGVQARSGSPSMRLLMNADVFYEFVPFGGSSDSRPVPAWKLEQGRVYALLITSGNGLWRYAIGDTVRVESLSPLEVTIAGRTKHFINTFGEEVMVHNTDAALVKACNATGAEVLNYTAAPVYADGRNRGHHQWLVEFARAPRNLDEFAAVLDKALQAENSDYQAKRAGDIFLAPLTVVEAVPGVFDRWLALTGKLGGQRKVPRLSNDRCFIEPLLRINANVNT